MTETPVVLIIDDTTANLGPVVGALEKQNYRVLVAQDGEEGLQRVDLVKPDLILLDVMMPGIDGFEVCKRLKAKPEVSEIPVIFMTALSDMTDKVNGFNVGGVDFISKPFQIDEMLARVGTHLKLRALQTQLEAQNVELRAYRSSLEEQVAARTEELRLASYALNQVREAALLLDEQGKIIYVNDEACRSLRYGVDELLRMSILDIEPNLSIATGRTWEQHWQDIRRRGAMTLESTRRRKDGGTFPVEMNASYFEYGGKAYILALARDITERKRTEKALADERMLFVGGPNVAFKWRAAEGWPVEYVSPNIADQFGYSPKELTSGKIRYIDIVHPDDLTRVAAEVEAFGTAKVSSFEQEYRIARADGDYRWIYNFTVIVRDCDGKISHYHGHVRDITERKIAERKLHASEQAFRALVENTPDYVARYDRECRRLYVNPAVARLMKRPAGELIGETPGADSPFADAQPFAETIRKVIQTGKEVSYESPYRTPEGASRWGHMRLVPEFGPDGAVASVLSIGRDIHDVKESELRFRTLAENIPDHLARFDKEGRYTYVNPAVARTLRIPAEDVVGKRFRDLDLRGIRRDGDDLEAAIQDVFATGKPSITKAIWTTGESKQTLEIRLMPERDASGMVNSIIGIGRDITALLESQERLRESYDMLQKLASQRESAREDERKRIAREIHDELGQYLTALRMHISALRIEFGSTNPAISERTQGMMALVDKTLLVARGVAAMLRPPVLDTGIGPALEWLGAEFARHSSIPCEVILPQERIELDEEHAIALFRIAQESLTNVARHAKATRVSLALSVRSGDAVIEVSDDGHGFDVEAVSDGSLGLVGMRERAIMVGGRIAVHSSPGRGTTITATIPLSSGKGTP